jgi:opacity protein-like surface antigen
MKSKILLTSLAAALAVSGANAAQYRPIKMSYGPQIRPFVGANIGMQRIDYSNQLKKDAALLNIDIPKDFVNFGIEGGFRFGNYHEIYNGGVTFNFDITLSDDVETNLSHIKLAEMRTMEISGTYDNYIRLSGDNHKRIDLVLGAGVGGLDEVTKWDHVGTEAAFGDKPANEHDWAFNAVLKLGFDFEMTKNVTLSAHTRMFVPFKSQYDYNYNMIFGGSVKYLF